MDTIIFKNVGKTFKKGQKLLLKEALLDMFKPSKSETFEVLKDINFSLEQGKTLGIIGNNGSGKSTILKIVAGVMFPDRGSVKVSGRIAPLIDVGAGFHPELTGRENIYLNGVILGLKRSEIDKKYQSIVDFAGLGDFIDTPIKHYSSGMYMRLGFSIAIHTDPDILLVDEILAVGDEAFQHKCFLKIKEFQRAKKTIIFVTHSLFLVGKYCDEVMLIDNGVIKYLGDPKIALEKYKTQES
jgi:ABC-type polysaccharide/polyol phosphate transport system ATPase subunit